MSDSSKERETIRYYDENARKCAARVFEPEGKVLEAQACCVRIHCAFRRYR